MAVAQNCGVLVKPGDQKVFLLNELINDFQDIDGDLVDKIIIRGLPSFGVLTFENLPIAPNFSFSVNALEKFKYVRISKSAYSDSFTYQVTDNNTNNKLSNMATMTINVNAYDNQPPSIGDNEITIAFGQTKVYTVADFTTNTTPPYSDPEGDGPFKLKVTTLPATGELQLNSVPINVNDEIFFTDIAKGFFTYVPDQSDPNGYDDDTFEYEISDLGSQQFSS
jgi:hypothetical protein